MKLERARIEEEEQTAAATAAAATATAAATASAATATAAATAAAASATTARKKTEVDVSVEAINQEIEAAAAIAQAEVLEAAGQQDGGEQPYGRFATEDPARRTEDYVRSLFSVNTSAPSQHGWSDSTDTEDQLGPRGEDAVPAMAHAAWDSHSHKSDPHTSAHTDAPQQARNPGSKYKREKQVVYPPFSVFLSFIREAAKTRNDPSFILGAQTTSSASHPRNERSTARYKDSRTPISVHRTDVPPTTHASPSQTADRDKKPRDLNKECPIHKKPHPLNKCFGFRMKPIEERKNLLREWGACFKCCASTTHLFKDCKEAMKCTECDSDRHIAALHPEAMKPKASKAPNPPTKQGGEEEVGDTPPPPDVSSIQMHRSMRRRKRR
ncbi:hypothetical protein FKM82_018657 [Ascaphus truei]